MLVCVCVRIAIAPVGCIGWWVYENWYIGAIVMALSLLLLLACVVSMTHAVIDSRTFRPCGDGFAVLSPPPEAAVADTSVPGYRLDFLVQDVLLGSLSTLLAPVLDTTYDGVGVTTPLPRSSSLIPESDMVGTDFVRVAGEWLRLNVTTSHTQGVPSRLGLAPSGAAGTAWRDMLFFTHPRGGWFVSRPTSFDPVGVLGDDPTVSTWLRCELEAGAGRRLCFVPASVAGSPGRVAVVPELQVVWVSPDRMALDVGSGASELVITVGGVSVSLRLDGYATLVFRTVRVLEGLSGNDVILGGGTVSGVVHFTTTAAGDTSMRLGVSPDAVGRVMGGVESVDVALMVVLFLSIVVWGTNSGSRLTASGASTTRSIAIAVFTMAACLFLVAREADGPVTAARMSLWTRCSVDVGFGRAVVTSFTALVSVCMCVFVLLVGRLASQWLLTTSPEPGPAPGSILRALALRTSVVSASTLCMIIAAFRVSGTGLSNRSQVLTMLVVVSCIGMMSRVADCIVLIPWHSSRPTMESIDHPGVLGSAAFVFLYTLNFLYVALVGLMVVLPLQTVVLSSFSISPVVHTLLTGVALTFLVWLTWRWGTAFTGKLPTVKKW